MAKTPSKKGIRIAVMSDMHCHPQAGADPASPVKEWHSVLHTDALRSDGNMHPIVALRSLIIGRLQADVLVCPGDLTNKVNQQGMMTGWGFVREVGSLLGCSTIVATLGNHDVDSRDVHKKGVFYLAKGVKDDFPVPVGACEDQFYSRGFCFVETTQIRLLMVNSVLEHHKEEKAKRGEWTNQQVELLKDALRSRTPRPIEIAVVHHHPIAHEDLGLDSGDVMLNGPNLSRLLADAGFLMIVHGHKHHPKLSYFNRGDSKLLVFASGSFSAVDPKGLLPSITRHLFHIVDIQDPTRGCGEIQTWEWNGCKGWNESTTRSADFPHRCGFGYAAAILDLARQVATKVGKRRRVFWNEVLQAFPDVSFLTYDDFVHLREQLLSKYGLSMAPKDADQPLLIGREDKTGGL